MHFPGTGECTETASHTEKGKSGGVACLPEEKSSSETKTKATREKNAFLRVKGDNADAPLSLLSL